METEFYINEATLEELLKLSGIGPVLAQRIIAARNFSNRDDVIGVNGIGSKSLASIEKENQIVIHFGFGVLRFALSDFIENTMKIRNDSAGLGHWHAPRGSRDHEGIDILTTNGQKVLAPIEGKITKHGYTKSGNTVLRYIEITGENEDKDLLVRLHYCTIENVSSVGTKVVRGQHVGFCQDVSGEYNDPNMKDHIHFELRVNGTRSDPTPFLNLA